MANKLLDLQDAVNMQLAPLSVLQFHLSAFADEMLPAGGTKNELNTMCDALFAGIENIKKLVSA